MTHPLLLRSLAALSVATWMTACRAPDFLRHPFERPSLHQRYERGLRRAGQDRTALGRDWLAAATRALRQAGEISPPFREAGYFPSDEAAAVGYRLHAWRGQRVVVGIEVQPADSFRLFVDLFERGNQPARPFRRVASGDSLFQGIDTELERDGEYLIRLQPELLRGGRFRVTIQAGASLTFPVSGVGSRAVKSRFGVERDGGRRRHEGIDIFAPRGTPAVAATRGIITGVGLNRLGGKVVWLWDLAQDNLLYYAHLDTQLVKRGTRVHPGDTLGLVGNTGNARTTPPHLHFGIYRPAGTALDPFPFVDQRAPPGFLPEIDPARYGTWIRTTRTPATLRYAPLNSSPIMARLPRATLMRVRGESGAWLRVVLPDGRIGFIASRLTEPAGVPVGRAGARTELVLRARPDSNAVVVDSLSPGARFSVLGRFGEFAYVRGPDGREGWSGE